MQNFASATIEMFDEQHGGRSNPTTAIGCVYRPHLKLGTQDQFLGVCFIDGPETITPGQTVDVSFLLLYDGVDYAGLVRGVAFLIVEGPHVVGKGIIRERWSN
jgi:translation elongation factor EF-Tu-like GTPase